MSFSQDWDTYVKKQFPGSAGERARPQWPGDEWGNEAWWKQNFDNLFRPCHVETWTAAAEIGQGSGKYTKMVLDAAPRCTVAAFDASEEFLRVCAERLAAEKAAGRLHLEHLQGKRSDEMILALERLGMSRKLDAFFSMDAMVHVDLQYLIVYLLTAALALRKGGHLIMTLADATSEPGFRHLMNSIRAFYSTDVQRVGKFEWMSPSLARFVLERLGFEIILLDHPPKGRGRDIHLVARLADLEPGWNLSWALCAETAGARKAESHPASSPPVLRWDKIKGCADYAVEFSFNRFENVVDLGMGTVRVPKESEPQYIIPKSAWMSVPAGRPLHWRVVALCSDRKRLANMGVLLRDAGG